MRVPLLCLLLLAPVSLTACNCGDSGLCRSAPSEGNATGYAPTARYAPGTETRVKLEVALIGLNDSESLSMGTGSAEARSEGPNVLALFDGGRVKVTWDGVPFKKDNAYVTVKVAPDARPTGTQLDQSYSTTMQTYLYKTARTTQSAGSVTMGILVSP
ncbi:hypothetical protein IHN32_00920 [Deinococcus sp. 14RED07]|uniref:hypothetical protein n=1 Tax=Deinococcus sp. 14RED07 TaxID=2745874 RepID=UPI001E35B16D|nr:hypothetical protein [Deinococcus sp. 14RED07]MCD0174517.1 hypothetical protein [Deinococcus sp. 14RED07]